MILRVPWSFPVLFLCVLVGGHITAGPLRAQVQSNPAFDRGTHGFRNILHRLQTENDMTALDDFALLHDPRPKETMIVIFGKLPQAEMDRLVKALPSGGLQRFVRDGGALFVVSDRSSDELFADFGVRISGTLLLNDSESATYQGNPACPLLEVARGSRTAEVPVFRNLSTLATNKPSYLRYQRDRRDPPLEALAHLPRDTYSEDKSSISSLFALGGAWGAGRALFMADHDLFINCMILQPDNDNAELAYNSLHWLAESDGGKRSRFLYVQDGIPNTDLDVPLEPLPFQTEEAGLAQLADAILDDIENNDLANELLRKSFSRGGILLTLLLVLCCGLAVYGIMRLSAMRHRPEPGMPLFALAALRYGPSRTPMSDRIVDLQERGNMLDAGRAVVRHFFDVVLASPAARPNPDRPPAVQPRGLADEEARLDGELRQLWKLAYGPNPRALSPAALAALLAQLRRLRRALRGWHLRMPAVSVDSDY